MKYTINEERLTADEYIEFLKKTDLGSQYPRERFRERISTLVEKASISLVARNDHREIAGVCFGITDLAYWLFEVPLKFMRLDFTIGGFTFSFWDIFIFCGLIAIFGALVSILHK